MRREINFILLIVLLLNISCSKCNDISCDTPANSFIFQLINLNTGEDLLLSEEIELDDIILINENDIPLNIGVDSLFRDDAYILFNEEMGNQTGTAFDDYSLIIGDKEFGFVYRTEYVTEGCCSFYLVDDISSNEILIEQEDDYLYYQFFINLSL